MLSVLASADAYLVRPTRDPGRKAGDIVHVLDLADVPGGY